VNDEHPQNRRGQLTTRVTAVCHPRMDRRSFLLMSLAGGLAAPLAAEAQRARKVYRVGVILTAAPNETEHLYKALRDGLRDLGYVEGQNVLFERRFADGRQERIPSLAAELVRLNVDVIVTGSIPVIAAVKRATSTIPVVMAVSRDPVGANFVASLARPGGNVTGLANDPAVEIQGKNLEFLKEVVPRLSRVALLWNSIPIGAESYRNTAESAARRLSLEFHAVAVRAREELGDAFAAVRRFRADGLMVVQDPVLYSARGQVVRLAASHRLPAVYALSEFVEVGGLMSYGVNIARQFRRAAVYVEKILNGAKPAELPVEQATQFELVINLMTAKALGLTIPPSLLARADQVIE
jgi:putative ABC transport system substrate-binding protein